MAGSLLESGSGEAHDRPRMAAQASPEWMSAVIWDTKHRVVILRTTHAHLAPVQIVAGEGAFDPRHAHRHVRRPENRTAIISSFMHWTLLCY